MTTFGNRIQRSSSQYIFPLSTFSSKVAILLFFFFFFFPLGVVGSMLRGTELHIALYMHDTAQLI